MLQKVDFDDLLRQTWSDRYENQRALFRSTLKFIHMRHIEHTPFKAYFNLQLIENKVASQINDPETEIIRDFNPDESTFLNIEDGETLFYADLENQTPIPKDPGNNSEHPVILNTVPICSYHSLLVPFLESRLNQVLSGHIAKLVLNIFQMSKSPYLRVGYNSILGNSSINHLHLHLINTDQLFPEEKRFPVEGFMTTPIIEHDGLYLGELKDYPIRGLLVRGKHLPELMSIILDTMLAEGIPHNLLFTSPEQAYIFPRKSQFEFLHEHAIKPAFAELSGLIICRNKHFYDELTMEVVKQKFSLMTLPEFDELVDLLKSALESE